MVSSLITSPLGPLNPPVEIRPRLSSDVHEVNVTGEKKENGGQQQQQGRWEGGDIECSGGSRDMPLMAQPWFETISPPRVVTNNNRKVAHTSQVTDNGVSKQLGVSE